MYLQVDSTNAVTACLDYLFPGMNASDFIFLSDEDSQSRLIQFFNSKDAIQRAYFDKKTRKILIKPDLELERAQKIAELTTACKVACETGFTSAVTGTPHHYGSTILDQQNYLLLLTGTDTDTLPVLCSESGDDWDFINHTRSQLQQLINECSIHVTTQRQRFHQLHQKASMAITSTKLAKIN